MTDFPGEKKNAPAGMIVRHFDSASAFLHALRPSQPWWTELNGGGQWVFRGQSCAEWSLIPRAFRQNDHDRILPLLYSSVKSDAERVMSHWAYPDENRRLQRYQLALLTLAEIAAVQAFEMLADELGHGTADELGGTLGPPWYFSGFYVDRRSIVEPLPEPRTFALAQHHRIPTRLLDFTRRPLVAAFFAAEEVVTLNDQRTSPLAVWGVATYALGRRIRLIHCPRHQMSFLHAQDALFLFDSQAGDEFFENGSWKPFENGLTRNWDSPRPAVVKLTLERHEALTLLKLLWTERVSRAHLMPTLDNVTHSLIASWSWDAPK